MLAEPILIGCIVAPSWAGAAVCIAAVLAFFARRAIAVGWVLGVGKGDASLRRLARAMACVLMVSSVAAMTGAVVHAADPLGVGIAIGVAAVFGLVQAAYEWRKQSRALPAELAGAAAMAMLGAMIVPATRVDLRQAAAIGLLLAVRQMLAIVYVRHRLRASRGMADGLGPIWLHPLVCVLVIAVLWAWGAVGWLAAVAVALLLVRAMGMHLAGGRPVTPKRVGMSELAIGLTYALLIAADQLVVGY